MKPALHKNIFYWPTWLAARDKFRAMECNGRVSHHSRIVAYERGYAIQRERSGPYWGSDGDRHEGWY